jgi:hypothetical protein
MVAHAEVSRRLEQRFHQPLSFGDFLIGRWAGTLEIRDPLAESFLNESGQRNALPRRLRLRVSIDLIIDSKGRLHIERITESFKSVKSVKSVFSVFASDLAV